MVWNAAELEPHCVVAAAPACNVDCGSEVLVVVSRGGDDDYDGSSGGDGVGSGGQELFF